MLATIVSLILVFLLGVFPPELGPKFPLVFLQAVMLVVPLFLVMSVPLLVALAINPLQRAEQTIAPRIVGLIRSDWSIKVGTSFLLAFLFGSLLLVLFSQLDGLLSFTLRLQIWVLMLGLVVDMLRYMMRCVLNYLNPFAIVATFKQRALAAVRGDRDSDVCLWVDALAEAAMKGALRGSVSSCKEVLDALQEVAETLFASRKSVTHYQEGEDVEKKVSYLFFFVLERIELINRKAIASDLEIVSGSVMATLGKIAIAAARYDVTMTPHPIQCIARCVRETSRVSWEGVRLKATCTLLAVANSVVEEIDLTYVDIKETFVSIINTLHEIAQESYKSDRGVAIAILIHPFADLKELFSGEKLREHQDAEALSKHVDQVIAEFRELSHAMRAIPASTNQEEGP